MKYSCHKGDVFLQLQYRPEHLDSDAVAGMVGTLLACANADYPRIVRVLTGDAILEELEKRFQEPGDAT